MPDHPMKRKAIENAKRARELRDAGDALGRQVLILMLKGGASDELIEAYDRWRDASIGKPNFHPQSKTKGDGKKLKRNDRPGTGLEIYDYE